MRNEVTVLGITMINHNPLVVPPDQDEEGAPENRGRQGLVPEKKRRKELHVTRPEFRSWKDDVHLYFPAGSGGNRATPKSCFSASGGGNIATNKYFLEMPGDQRRGLTNAIARTVMLTIRISCRIASLTSFLQESEMII